VTKKFASVHTLQLSLEDYRRVKSEVPDADGIRFIADQFAQLIMNHLPNQRPILVGFSIGSWFAFETAQALQRRGAPVPQLLLMEPGTDIIGGVIFRKHRTMDLFVSRPLRALRFWRYFNNKVSRLTEEQNEIEAIVGRLLGCYQPQPTTVPICALTRNWRLRDILFKNSRPWRYASLRRLAKGRFEEELMPLDTHSDFVSPKYTKLISAQLQRVVTDHIKTGDDLI
jgi:pimeloyl-ACP methyl ester carboxylesterase